MRRGTRRWAVALGAVLLLAGASVTASAAEAAPSTARFTSSTPTTGLVEGDPLVLRGEGFAPNDYFGVVVVHGEALQQGNKRIQLRQCVGEVSTSRVGARCSFDPVADFTTSATTFDRTVTVHRTFDTRDGPVDCRVRACRILMTTDLQSVRVHGTGRLLFAAP